MVRRFNQRGLEILSLAPGRGRKRTYGGVERSQIVQELQNPPDRNEDQTGTWSLFTLQRTLRRKGLPKVGASTIRRILQEAGYSYQQSRTWCPTGQARRVRKAGVVTVYDPEAEGKKTLIELAYTHAEHAGVVQLCAR